ncbi:MAG: hypothetical protein ACD_7C00297G0004 [uncultured bacterium]|nr:MAG: hypothetical protein ACD_7C00297G0004 [uncultured bacterium]HBR79169.1 hypothetical protein [Candidatus Moranbacteria bacterium]
MYLVEVKKIKATLLIFFLLLFFGYSLSIIAQENSNGNNVFSDADQDGLSDTDESRYGTDPKNSDSDSDGYQDGAEIKSGYDPLKPAPGDKINAPKAKTNYNNINIDTKSPESGNLTDEFSARIAEMVESGGEGGVDMGSINSLIEEKLAGDISFEDLPEIDESKIKMKKQNYSGYGKEKQARKNKEDDEEYLSSIFYIMTNNLPHSIDSKESIEGFSDEIMKMIPSVVSPTGNIGVTYFTDLADKGSAILEKLNDLEVPADMLDIHKKGLRLATYAISLKEKVKVDVGDPIASLVSFSEVEKIMVLANDYISETEAKLKELDLTNFVMEKAGPIL